MKRLIFSLLIICSVQLSYAQIPVTDVAMNTNTIVNQVLNSMTWGQQLTQMIQQGKTLATTLKYLQEVSSVVRDVSYTKDLIKRQGNIVSACQRVLKNDGKLDAATARVVTNSVSSLLTTNRSLVDLVNSTLTSRFKMNDGERFQMLNNIKQEQQRLLEGVHRIDMIISTSKSTKEIMELRIFK